MKQYLERLRDLGYEKPRAAGAQLALAFFGLLYLLISLNAPPGWGPAFACLSLCYLVAFMGLGSEWFWARWFASGLGWSGMMVGIASLVMVGWHPMLAVYGGLHALVVVLLLGSRMAQRYDLQPDWRQRYGMDDFGVDRLRKAVTRGSAALPSLIVWALGPKDGSGMTLAVLLAAALAVLGVGGLVRLRTWGVLALGGAATAVVVGSLLGLMAGSQVLVAGLPVPAVALFAGAVLTAHLWLLAAIAPLAGPLWRHFRTLR